MVDCLFTELTGDKRLPDITHEFKNFPKEVVFWEFQGFLHGLQIDESAAAT